MDVYHCMIELKDPDNSLGFADAAAAWYEYLQEKELIESWRILRRKFGLASSDHSDFIVELEVKSMATLQDTFARISTLDDEEEKLYRTMNEMIDMARIGLYRSYPDAIKRERISLV